MATYKDVWMMVDSDRVKRWNQLQREIRKAANHWRYVVVDTMLFEIAAVHSELKDAAKSANKLNDAQPNGFRYRIIEPTPTL